jgi:hypothetical protein
MKFKCFKNIQIIFYNLKLSLTLFQFFFKSCFQNLPHVVGHITLCRKIVIHGNHKNYGNFHEVQMFQKYSDYILQLEVKFNFVSKFF